VRSGVIDTRSLCILSGKFVWRIFVDLLVLDTGGNLVDTSCIAALAALADTKLPKLRLYKGEGEGDWDVEVDDDPHAHTPIPAVASLPLALTFSQVGGYSVVDALPEEEACAESRVTVAVNRAGKLASVQTEGPGGVDPAQLHACLQAAERIAPVLFGRIDRAIAASAAKAAAGGEVAAADARHAAGTSLLADRAAALIGKANAVQLEEAAGEGGAGAGAGSRRGTAAGRAAVVAAT
jgi:exosome complex component RRP42